MKPLGTYTNGNYTVIICDDGTKIKQTIDPDATEFITEFPESIDLKITNRCNKQCVMCHEGSSPSGKHAELKDAPFIDTLHPFTELAIGGGNVLEHPYFIEFLEVLKRKQVLPSITLHQDHFLENVDLIDSLVNQELIRGIGVSAMYPLEVLGEITTYQKYPNLVLHVINGMIHYDDLAYISGYGLKLLILGYKSKRRGKDWLYSNAESVAEYKTSFNEHLKDIYSGFKIVSFDNLAIQQLDVKAMIPKEQWELLYMGDEGSHTFYIDAVSKKFAISSTHEETYDMLDSVDDMFKVVQEKSKETQGSAS